MCSSGLQRERAPRGIRVVRFAMLTSQYLRSALMLSPPEHTSIETTRRSLEAKSDTFDPRGISSLHNDANGVYTPKPILPSSPTSASHDEKGSITQNGKPKTSIDDTEKDKDKDKSAGKKVQKMLKNRVHKEQRRISTIGRKIGHGVGRQRGGLTLRRTSSTPSKEYSISPSDRQSR